MSVPIFSVIVPGKPVAKERARVITREGATWAYLPSESADAEEKIQGYVTAELLRMEKGDWKAKPGMAYRVELSYTFATKTKAKRGTPHTQRPDLDNLVKLALDALKPWVDDAQIAQSHAEKWWMVENSTMIELYELELR